MAPSPNSVVPDSLHQLCDRLTALHVRVDVSDEAVCGEPDLRLRVCRPDDPTVSVELLVPDLATWPSRTWDAARVEHGRRRMWRGPDSTSPPEDVATFAHALLCLSAEELRRRYAVLD